MKRHFLILILFRIMSLISEAQLRKMKRYEVSGGIGPAFFPGDVGRYTFSDGLDGYTSQYSSSNDVYYFLNFVISCKLKTGENGWPSFR